MQKILFLHSRPDCREKMRSARRASGWLLVSVLSAAGMIAAQAVAAQDIAAKTIRITIPRYSEMTPVQRLNREGVDALIHNHYEKAQGYFYKAYLYDPADPFTLTNLGYVAELQGQVEGAEKFYKLAAEQTSTATIAQSNIKELKGRPMMDALGTLKNNPMRVNRMNVLGMELLAQDRGFEAEKILKAALAVEPQNPFTLNNLGVDEEANGDLESALTYYDQAAATRSKQPVIVTLDRAWRGKPVSEMAASSAKKLRKRMKTMDLGQIRSAMLSIRGVEALNENDWDAAKKDFQEAYSFNPQSAFALNNLGYVAEKGGDFETAKSFYQRAKMAEDSGARIGLATRSSAEGQPLLAVAEENHNSMDIDLDAYRHQQLQKKGSYLLRRRDGSVVDAPASGSGPVSDKDANHPEGSDSPDGASSSNDPSGVQPAVSSTPSVSKPAAAENPATGNSASPQ
jgi:tetratricopeptide (TPR) repeat protein